MDQDKIVTVFEDTMSSMHVVMASIMYTFAFCPLLYYLYLIVNFDLGHIEIIKIFSYVISLTTPFVVSAINISEENTVKVNITQNQLITEQKIVFYKKTKTAEVEIFDYVAINRTVFGYSITLCYQYNGYRHIRLISFYKKEKAFRYAKSLCRVLNVDLLDKIDLNNPIWIDKSEL